MKIKKIETFAEYLARGGKVTIIPAVKPNAKPDVVKLSTPGGPSTIITMSDADLFYGETKARKAKKVKATINLSLHLPEALRKKYVDSIINRDNDDES